MSDPLLSPVPVPPGAPALDASLALVATDACTWCGGTGRDSFPGEQGRCVWHRCRACGFWVNSLHGDPADYADEGYDLEYHHQHYGRALGRKLRNSLASMRLIEALAPGRGELLDIGSSYGYMLQAGAARGWTTHGVDISPAMVELGRQRGLDIQRGSLTEIPFADEQMDVVHARHVLEHDIETYRALAELKRVLKPGGLLVCEVPNACSRAALSRPAETAARWSYLHMVTFTPTVLAGFLGRAGFTPIAAPGWVSGPAYFQARRLWLTWRQRAKAKDIVSYWRKPA